MMQASNVQAKLADVANFQINLLKVKLSTQCTAAYSLARSLARGDDSPNRIPLPAWQQRISPPLRASCFVLRSDRPTEETDEASSSVTAHPATYVQRVFTKPDPKCHLYVPLSHAFVHLIEIQFRVRVQDIASDQTLPFALLHVIERFLTLSLLYILCMPSMFLPYYRGPAKICRFC